MIGPLQSAAPWTELVAMRLVLRQPSPSWHTFHVEEIHVFAEPPRRVRRHGQGHGLAPLQGPSLVTPQGRPVSPALGPIGDQRAGADVSRDACALGNQQTRLYHGLAYPQIVRGYALRLRSKL